MRILKETKDYIIVYHPSAHKKLNDYYLKYDANAYYHGCLVDTNTEMEYYHYQKDTDNFEKDIIKLGKNLIKKYKRAVK